MLAIRMQRTGRKGHAQFRVIVQDARRTPTSGKVVVQLGSYNPHTKTLQVDKDKASFYLSHGAQPSDRVARLLKAEGVKLPTWVKVSGDRERTVRNPEKRRSTRPADADKPAEAEAVEEIEAPLAEVAEAPKAEAETKEEAETPAEPVASEDSVADKDEKDKSDNKKSA